VAYEEVYRLAKFDTKDSSLIRPTAKLLQRKFICKQLLHIILAESVRIKLKDFPCVTRDI
jgi:hypothetical protein